MPFPLAGLRTRTKRDRTLGRDHPLAGEQAGMAKAKSKFVFMAADGKGGMAQVEDRRFEPPGRGPSNSK